jgi:hypothetical protein
VESLLPRAGKIKLIKGAPEEASNLNFKAEQEKSSQEYPEYPPVRRKYLVPPGYISRHHS